MDKKLHDILDEIIEERKIKDDFGMDKFSSKKDLVDEAVKSFLINEGCWPPQEVQ